MQNSLLWSRSNVVDFHPEGLGLIPNRVRFLFQVLPGVFPLNCKKKSGNLGTCVPIKYCITIIKNILPPFTLDAIINDRR